MAFLIVLAALCFLMYVAYRGHSVILFAPIAALGAVLLTDPQLVAPMFTGLFMDKMVGFLKLYFPVFLLGAMMMGGAQGGYLLTRPADAISLADIVEAVEGPIALTLCAGNEGVSDCALDARCRIKPHMGVVGSAVRGALDAVTLQELAR